MKIFNWNEPELFNLQDKVIENQPLSEKDTETLLHQKNNPDIRVRETARAILIAANNEPGKNNIADKILEKRNLRQLQAKLIVLP